MSELLEFKRFDIKDKEPVEELLKNEDKFLCAHNFADLYIWQYAYKTDFAIFNNYLILRSGKDGEYGYTLPKGKKDGEEFLKAFDVLKKEAGRKKIKLFSVTEWQKEVMEAEFGDKVHFEYDRNSADYIYTSESLITLKGKKLHGKRNHLNKFKNDYAGRWNFEELDEFNREEFYAFQLMWTHTRDDEGIFEGETAAVKALLDNIYALGVKGGLIRLDGKVIAMTLGTQMNTDVFVVNIEKALPEYNGAYQLINNEFARRNLTGYRYINREEDMGIEGLRKAKLSYLPEMMGQVYGGYYID